jgi:hypothetical protein
MVHMHVVDVVSVEPSAPAAAGILTRVDGERVEVGLVMFMIIGLVLVSVVFVGSLRVVGHGDTPFS